ncbi:MAG: hypothetical protein JWM99_3986, partial [Verrucomicrobiales bacterium]|nr:hypothetical protein [Verrucomicrobiales bacterium]
VLLKKSGTAVEFNFKVCFSVSRTMRTEMNFDRSLRVVLDDRTADDLKQLVTLVPGIKLKAPRKLDVMEALERYLLGPGAMEVWSRLSSLEQSAVAEAVHDPDGSFNQEAFRAKYGKLPVLEVQDGNRWQKKPTLLRLFLHRAPGESAMAIPADLREKLLTFVPEPAATELTTLAEIPTREPRDRTSREWDGDKVIYKSEKAPLLQRMTEQEAIHDLRTVLRLAEQEKLAVSAKTHLPSAAARVLLDELLRGNDYFPLIEKRNKWDPEIGAVKGFSWPLLLQAAKLAAVRGEKLSLSKSGRSALEASPAQTLKGLWESWLTNGIIDEFSRIDTIKGQNGKEARNFTSPATRRRTISSALEECPVGRWVETGEFSRYLLAAGFEFQVASGDHWGLYISDPKHGSLGYNGYGGWNIMEERYLLCLLFEYAAPLGIIDIAYEHPDGARNDFREQWGTDDLIFLSRYDGLKYFRLTPLGAFVLGKAETYELHDAQPGVSLSILPNGRIRIDQGELSSDQTLLLQSFAEREGSAQWSLDEARALKSVENGAGVAQFRAFLSACDPQPLPETVEGFLANIQKRGNACVFKARALMIECVSPEVADLIASNSRMSKLCQRTGDRGLVVLEDKEKAFREALNSIGYGMPRV